MTTRSAIGKTEAEGTWRFDVLVFPKNAEYVGSEGSNLSHFWRAKNLGKILIFSKNALGHLNIMLLGIH